MYRRVIVYAYKLFIVSFLLLLPILDLRFAGFEGIGDGMPITAFDGPGEGIVFR